MATIKLEPITLLQLLTEFLSRLLTAMVWLGKQTEVLEIEVPDHLEPIFKIPKKDGPACLLIRKPTDDDALLEVLRLVFGAMGKKEPAPRRTAAKPGSHKRR